MTEPVYTSLLRAHIRETDRRFEELKEDLQRMDNKLDTIQEFRIQNIATARTISFIVSGLCGLLTMVATVALAYFSRH